MPAHRYHPNPEFEDGPDNPDALFFDFCEECERQAKDPVFYLDYEKMHKLYNRMVDVEVGNGGYKSNTEAKACKALWPVYIFIERFTAYSPTSIRWFRAL